MHTSSRAPKTSPLPGKPATTTLRCDDTVADFGTPADGEGLSAGEPEQYSGDYFRTQAALDLSWQINVELIGREATRD